MSDLSFRNVDATPDDPVESWPYEALIAAIERGYLSEWRRIGAAIRRSPWGQVARDVETYSGYAPGNGPALMLRETVRRARNEASESERSEVASRVRAAVSRSGMTAESLARLVGTSPARMSTYASGKVVPSAAMLLRIEKAAAAAPS